MSKPVGSGYTSTVTVFEGSSQVTTSSKPRDISPAVAEGITGNLQPGKTYNVSFQISCTDHPNLISTTVYTTVQTFQSGTIPSVPCSSPQPTHVAATSPSYDSITVVWQKPFGDGYKYKVTVKIGQEEKATKNGTSDVSLAGSVTFTGLQAATNYTVDVQLACDNQEAFTGQSISTTVKTLPGGSSFAKYKLKTRT